MKKLITTFTATLLASSVSAQPDKDWWACQVVHVSGMNWENNQWVTRTFSNSTPFVLMSDGNGSLTKESASKLLDVSDREVKCKVSPYKKRVTCADGFGGNAFFDTEAAKGGVSKIYGSVTVETDHRDSIFVKAFECVKG